MRVLFASPVVPWPADSGGRIRTSNLLRAVGREVELHLRCVQPPGAPVEPPPELAAACASISVLPRSSIPGLGRWTRTRPERWFHSSALHDSLQRDLATGEFDLLHLDEVCLVRTVPTNCPVPVCVHHHKLERDLAAVLPATSPLHRFVEVRRHDALEREAVARFPDQILCSAEDAARLGERQARARCGVVPSGFDPEHFQPRPTRREPLRLLFLGTLSYGPNEDALLWFEQRILPAVLRAHPRAVIEVVGRDPTPAVQALAGPHVRVVGGVDDVRDALARCAVLVAPIRVGGGTRLKLVEALASGCPVVATPTAAEGLALEHGEHLWLGASATEFAAAVVDALAHPAEAAARAARGRARCLERYTWRHLAGELLACWQRVASGTTPQWEARPPRARRAAGSSGSWSGS